MRVVEQKIKFPISIQWNIELEFLARGMEWKVDFPFAILHTTRNSHWLTGFPTICTYV